MSDRYVAESFSSYDDSRERKAFKKLLKNDKPFRHYLVKKFGHEDLWIFNRNEKGVDYYVWIGPDSKNLTKIGMIEIDYKSIWKDQWPQTYDTFHHLDRKMRYMDENLAYLHCTFNDNCDRIISYTEKEIKKARGPIEKRMKNGKVDVFWEIPLYKTMQFGNWPESELMKFKKRY